MISREKWCVNIEKGIIRNTVNGLYLKRVSISVTSGGTAIIGMTSTASSSSDWDIVNIRNNIYILVSKLMQKDLLKKALVSTFDENGKAILTVAEFNKEKEEQMWIFNKV